MLSNVFLVFFPEFRRSSFLIAGGGSRCQIEVDVAWNKFVSHEPEGDWSDIAPFRSAMPARICQPQIVEEIVKMFLIRLTGLLVELLFLF
jgi:hypothetical protein